MQDVKFERYKYIGGSDVPIIMGLSHFKTRYQLLLEKAQLKEDTFDGNDYTEYGNIMEPKIRQYINVLFKRDFKEDKIIQDDVRCHFDGIDKDMILEIKTTSQINQDVNDYKVYLVQLLFYMMYANKQNGMLAVYERPEDFNEDFDSDRLQIFTIKIDDYQELCVEIMESLTQFRFDLQKIKDNPFLSEEDLVDNNVTIIANEIIELENHLKLYKELEKRKKTLLDKLKTAMEENNIKGWEMPNGTKIILVKDGEDKIVKKFNEKKFKEDNELLYNKYLEDKLQKGKSGYVLITIKGEKNEQ